MGLERSVYSHLLTSRHAVPLMQGQNAGLIVEVTDGDTLGYRGNFFYDLVKTTVIRLAHNMAEEFRGKRINVSGKPDGARRPAGATPSPKTPTTLSPRPRTTSGGPSSRWLPIQRFTKRQARPWLPGI